MRNALVKSSSRLFGAVALLSAALASMATAADSFPADAPPALAPLLGQYGPADAPLTIYESSGRLMADGQGLHAATLRPLSSRRFATEPAPETAVRRLSFDVDRDGHVRSVTLDRDHLPVVDIGQQAIDVIRAGVQSNAPALRAAALQTTPPAEPAPHRESDLVDLTTVDPSIKLDIRYATSNNFMGFPLYEKAAAYLQRPAALALGRAARDLASHGYGLLIHDAYRPWYVTRMFWEATPPSAHIFVADPAEGSRHNRGCAVDLTLYALTTGETVVMTGRYDEMSPRSFANFPGGTSRQRYLRDLLRKAMEAQGFTVYPEEWWHFDYRDWKDYGLGNVPFARLDELKGASP